MVAQDLGKHQLKAYILKLIQRIRSPAPCLVTFPVLCFESLTNIRKGRSWLSALETTGTVISCLQGLYTQAETTKWLMASKCQKPT